MIFLIILLTAIFLLLVFDYLFSDGFKRKRSFENENREKFPLPEPVEKEIMSFDGTELKGYFFINERNPDTMVILFHGYRGNHRQMEPFADYYYNELGYSVLAPDMRCHGKSKGDFIGFGCLEKKDAECWVDYVREMLGEKAKIFLHGVSMGAATALMTAAECNVSGVISDCAYANGVDIIKKQIKREYHLPVKPVFFLVNLAVKLRCGYSLFETNTSDFVKVIKCPVLYIHGENDDFISSASVYKLYSDTTSQKFLWICENAGHCESALKNREVYGNRVRSFISGIS